MPNVGALVLSYGLTRFLKPVLKQYAWVDRVIVLNFRFIKTPETHDDTESVVDDLAQSNVGIISGNGLKQHEILNFGLDELKNFDAVFIADSDELIQHQDQQKILHEFSREGVGCCPLIDYAVDYDHRYPLRSHKPPVIVKPTTRFYVVRCYSSGAVFFDDCFIHHLGFLYPDMSWKIAWEDNYEEGATKKIMSQEITPCVMPSEIRKALEECEV